MTVNIKNKTEERIITVWTDHTITFSFPEIILDSYISITFSQNGQKIIEYTDLDEGVNVGSNTIALHMTPEETAKFIAAPDSFAIVQVNIIRDGKRRATRQIRIPVRQNLKSEAMA